MGDTFRDRLLSALKKATMKKPVDIIIEFSDEVYGNGIKIFPVDRYSELPLNINTVYSKSYIMRDDENIKAIRINKADSLIAKIDIMDEISENYNGIIDYDNNLKALRLYDGLNKLEVYSLIAKVYTEEDYDIIIKGEPILRLNSVNEKTIFTLPIEEGFIGKLKKIVNINNIDSIKLSIDKNNGDVYIYPDENVYISLSFKLGQIDNNPEELLKSGIEEHNTVINETVKINDKKNIDVLSMNYLTVGWKNIFSVLDSKSDVELRLLNTGALVIIEDTKAIDGIKALYGIIPNAN